MPVRDLIIAISLLAFVILVAFGAAAAGSEYYLFFPATRLFGLYEFSEPPTSPWTILFMVALPVAVFFVSRRNAAIFLTVPLILAIIGLPVAVAFFDWTPGFAQYLMIICLGSLAVFVWTHDDFHQD